MQDKGKPLAFIPCLKPKCGFLSQPHFQGFSAFFLINNSKNNSKFGVAENVGLLLEQR
jgi:hypothetical protein